MLRADKKTLAARMGSEAKDMADAGDESRESEVVITSGVDGFEMANEEDGAIMFFGEAREAEKDFLLTRGGGMMKDGLQRVDDDERGVGTLDGGI